MKVHYAVLAASLAAVMLLSSGCEKLRARDNLNQGVQAFKAAKYSDAVERFKTAVDLDPNFATARLYLATAYEMQYVPGSDAPDNVQYAKSAMDEFHKVLDQDPKNELATSSIASLYYNEKNFDQAGQWHHKVIALNPNNKESYYTLGVLAWQQWLPVDRQARLDCKMTPEAPGPIKDAKVRENLKVKWMPILDEGIKDEQKALQIDPTYDNAMTYMNLLIRYRADLLDSGDEYNKAIEQANNWMQKSLETMKANTEKKAAAAANGAKTQ